MTLLRSHYVVVRADLLESGEVVLQIDDRQTNLRFDGCPVYVAEIDEFVVADYDEPTIVTQTAFIEELETSLADAAYALNDDVKLSDFE